MAWPIDPIYKLVKEDSNEIGVVREYTRNGTKYQYFIPFAAANSDYQNYLEWKAAGNTPAPADGPSDWDLARQKRDRLLSDSDWTMITGATVDQAQWSAYREKLRDIPQTYKGKATSEIVWPTAPSTKGPNS